MAEPEMTVDSCKNIVKRLEIRSVVISCCCWTRKNAVGNERNRCGRVRERERGGEKLAKKKSIEIPIYGKRKISVRTKRLRLFTRFHFSRVSLVHYRSSLLYTVTWISIILLFEDSFASLLFHSFALLSLSGFFILVFFFSAVRMLDSTAKRIRALES